MITHRLLKKLELRDNLNDYFSHRPGPLDLLDKNILRLEEDSLDSFHDVLGARGGGGGSFEGFDSRSGGFGGVGLGESIFDGGFSGEEMFGGGDGGMWENISGFGELLSGMEGVVGEEKKVVECKQAVLHTTSPPSLNTGQCVSELLFRLNYNSGHSKILIMASTDYHNQLSCLLSLYLFNHLTSSFFVYLRILAIHFSLHCSLRYLELSSSYAAASN